MQAATCPGPGEYPLEEVPVPRPPHTAFGTQVTADWSIVIDDTELDGLGTHLGPHCWPGAIRMIESGCPPLDEICTRQLPDDDFEQPLDLVSEGTKSIKVSLIPA